MCEQLACLLLHFLLDLSLSYLTNLSHRGPPQGET
jgi:hypothetical protein